MGAEINEQEAKRRQIRQILLGYELKAILLGYELLVNERSIMTS